MQICFSQWMQTSGPLSNWVYAFASNGSNLYFGFDEVFLSTDDGMNWKVVSPELPFNTLITSFAVSPDGANFFAGTSNNGVFLTTNNGTNWTEVNSGLLENGWVQEFAMCSNISGGIDLFTGVWGGIYLSTNNGANWSIVSEVGSLSSLAVISNNAYETKLFAGFTYGMGLFRYTKTDTGWIVDHVITNNSVFSLAVIESDLFASTYDGVYLSTDDGASWTMVNPNLESIDAFSISSNGNTFLVCVGTGGVYISTNNGANWTDFNEGFPSNTGVFKFAVNDTYIFAATDNGIWRRPLTEIITSVESLSELPVLFILKQNYPNPFNSSSAIKYSIPKSTQVSLKIYNTLGKEIETLVNEEKPTGTYEVTWHAGNLPGGVYFYQLNAGGLIESRKMILSR